MNDDVRKDYLDDTTSEDILEIKTAIGELTRGKEPKQLRFYSGGKKEALQLIATARQRVGALSKEVKPSSDTYPSTVGEFWQKIK